MQFDFQGYPYDCPKFKMVTQVYHCNVHPTTGEMCLGDLTQKWAPTTTVSDLLLGIRTSLSDPAPEHALNADAAKVFTSKRDNYDKTAKEWTKKHAK